MKIGFIGLGTMGMPMAKNILKAGQPMMVFDLVEEKTDYMKALGAEVAVDNAQLAKECDIIFLSLLMPEIVESVVNGPNGLLENSHQGQRIVDTSTNSYRQSIRLSEIAEKKGVMYMDLPVSGGAGRAADGTLSLVAGASEPEIDEAGLKPLFDKMGSKIHYGGKRGAGVGLKILNNMLSKAILFADGEAVMMAEHMGIPFETLYDVISTSSSQNEILRIKKEHIENHEYSPSAKSYFPIKGTMKDLNLARELGEDLGVASFGCSNAIQWYRMAMKNGYSDKDSSAIVEFLRELHPAGE